MIYSPYLIRQYYNIITVTVESLKHDCLYDKIYQYSLVYYVYSCYTIQKLLLETLYNQWTRMIQFNILGIIYIVILVCILLYTSTYNTYTLLIGLRNLQRSHRHIVRIIYRCHTVGLAYVSVVIQYYLSIHMFQLPGIQFYPIVGRCGMSYLHYCSTVPLLTFLSSL